MPFLQGKGVALTGHFWHCGLCLAEAGRHCRSGFRDNEKTFGGTQRLDSSALQLSPRGPVEGSLAQLKASRSDVLHCTVRALYEHCTEYSTLRAGPFTPVSSRGATDSSTNCYRNSDLAGTTASQRLSKRPKAEATPLRQQLSSRGLAGLGEKCLVADCVWKLFGSGIGRH